ncbi:MAG: DUF4831 family protein [Muribaculaceae bacterium]|nr:DUF4831 family protein [Muribaculaceae bacterium]
MKHIFFLMALLGNFFIINAQQTKLLTAEKHNEYGLVYTLPVTAFQIEIVATKEIQIAGPFSKYSKLFTADSKVITEDEVKWTIESVKVTPYGVPDSENRYVMQLKAGATTYIGVADDGMLLTINKQPSFSTPDALTVTPLEGSPINGKEYLEFVNEDFTSAQSSYKQAQILAEELQEIRDAKLSLTRGTAETMPTDGRQLEIMLASLDEQEKALMNAFTGASWKERVVRSFTYLPEKEGKSVLCRFSVTDGIVDANDYFGEPVYITVNVTEEAEMPVDAKGEEKKIPKDAVIYCIPGTADLSLSYMGNPIFNKSYGMSQFGMLFGLNPTLFTDKKEPSYAIFDPTTGALKELATLKQ